MSPPPMPRYYDDDRPLYFDRQGRPLTQEQYLALMIEKGRTYKRVAWTELTDGITVSTVWLGIDHEWRPKMPPLIFETMVFVDADEIGGLGEGTEQYRYSTELQAIEGHLRVVLELAGTLALDDIPNTEIHRAEG